MSEGNVVVFQKTVNREERKRADRVRRMCAHHNLKLIRRRDKQFHLGENGYQLRSFAIVAGNNYELSLEDVVKVCHALNLKGAQ